MPVHAALSTPGADLRDRIVRAAAELLRAGGREALTTRAVEAAAGVQAPAIYRLFGHKQGLIGAVAEYEITGYIARKQVAVEDDAARDPVEVLADGWRDNVHFGLENPDLFLLINDAPRTEQMSDVLKLGEQILRTRVRRIAQSGRLAVSEDRAVNLITASARGATLTLIAMHEDERDVGMLEDMLTGLMSTITSDVTPERGLTTAAAAGALRTSMTHTHPSLSPGEAAMLEELLLRLSRLKA